MVTPRNNTAAGFTLIEMVAVIVISGILAIGVTDYIVNSARSYDSAATRNQVSAAGRAVIERISMELHNALPHSVRTSTPLTSTDEANGHGYEGDQCLEFIPVEAATTYINPTFRPSPPSAAAFDVINLVPDQVGAAGRYAVIYPTRTSDLYKDSYGTTEVIEDVTIADADPNDGIQELTPAGAHRFPRRSPVERLFITTQPVSFCVSGPKLFRYSNYGFSSSQLVPRGPMGACIAASCLPASTPERELVTDQLDNSVLSDTTFDFLAVTRRRNGVVQMEFNFTKDGEVVRLNHEVLQQATP